MHVLPRQVLGISRFDVVVIMDVATLDDQVIARNRKVHWYTTSNHLNMTVPKIYPTTPSTEEEWSERKTDGGIAESYSSVSTYAESENEAQSEASIL
ncbi:hypothetical protein POPTR_011G051000v4 [Populus trichocarpa]|uniref:Uncharacterized protein n=2 Tax=Populus trichocarpa TaxID=3694 RepID=A0ACC0S7P4_POPTR|nr:hypothetical protein BDE02_11G041900 [Populus trichocarpa]KAI5570625.1 hypothetical protein BDE02_11G041900 [Populus trichocarpa]KAI9385303.1 hypothetical protein POPTR_011G051000v4 [Populus trichocarpa]KAI9385304.1 hypothetical protein POPTR_011G051000v4 [Populus trichocarpa]